MDNHLLIKPIIKVGNSAGILLPKKWLNGKVKVELIENPLDIRRDILEILDEYLEDIKGIYLIGSYARREQTSRSDVDVLVITNKFAEKIKKGKYDLWLIPENSLKEQLKNNALPLVPMITEAKPLINSKLLEEYKPLSLNEKNLRFHLETTESALEIAKQTLDIIKLKQENNCSDSLIYSLVLRLREVYIVD
jgi:predicted nucleotidyltransferase